MVMSLVYLQGLRKTETHASNPLSYTPTLLWLLWCCLCPSFTIRLVRWFNRFNRLPYNVARIRLSRRTTLCVICKLFLRIWMTCVCEIVFINTPTTQDHILKWGKVFKRNRNLMWFFGFSKFLIEASNRILLIWTLWNSNLNRSRYYKL